MTTTPEAKIGAYATHQRENEDARETDRRALLSCASRLQTAIENGGQDMMAYGDAIRLNQKLWTLFQVSLCDPDNQLPKETKTGLLTLSRYVDRVSFRAVSTFAPQLLNSLIDINRTIATGLGMKPKAPTAPPSPDITAQSGPSAFNASA